MEITVSELLNSLTNLLSEKLDTARLDVEVLCAFALNWDKSKLYSHSDYVLSQQEQDRIAELVNRRLNGEPIAYIVGYQEFWSLPFIVSPATLIPRPETEHLIEEALKIIPQSEVCTVVDLGTGSGAIALTIARERPMSIVSGVDFSKEALFIAIENQKTLDVRNVEFMQSNWFEDLQGKRFNVIVSNPPYIAENDPHLSRGDVAFEPESALVSGADGLQAIKEIVSQAKDFMHESAWLLLEHGYQQAESVRELMRLYGYNSITTITDLSGNERITFAQK